MESRETEPIEGSASPLKPRVAMAKRSSSSSFEVAWRSTARTRSSGDMPQPSSTTRTSSCPPPAVTTSIRVAPASTAFSTSSLTTLAGRSTTSPAAIRSIRTFGRARTGMSTDLGQAGTLRFGNADGPSHRDDERLAVREEPLRGALHIRHSDLLHELVAAIDVVEAEALELDLRELVGDLRRGVEAQGVRAGNILLGAHELCLARALAGHPLHLGLDDRQ